MVLSAAVVVVELLVTELFGEFFGWKNKKKQKTLEKNAGM